MAGQNEQERSNQRVGDAAAGLGIPREWVNDPYQGLSPRERFERQRDGPQDRSGLGHHQQQQQQQQQQQRGR
ncbi:hypothetical protein HOY80DRAFT_1054810 [Tuber brumale]|nr:hypothetical protein HOY80DRAFT_1054810 [Tuber brumale]